MKLTNFHSARAIRCYLTLLKGTKNDPTWCLEASKAPSLKLWGSLEVHWSFLAALYKPFLCSMADPKSSLSGARLPLGPAWDVFGSFLAFLGSYQASNGRLKHMFRVILEGLPTSKYVVFRLVLCIKVKIGQFRFPTLPDPYPTRSSATKRDPKTCLEVIEGPHRSPHMGGPGPEGGSGRPRATHEASRML